MTEGEVCLDGEKMTEWPSKLRADYQNHAIGWLQRGVQFSWRWDSGTISTNSEVIWEMSV